MEPITTAAVGPGGKEHPMSTLIEEKAHKANQALVVRLPHEMHEQVKRQAEEEERTMAQIVRRALRDYLTARRS